MSSKVIGIAALGAAAIAAVSFGLVSLLPQPTRGERLGVRALGALQQRHGVGALMSIEGEPLVAGCRRLPPWRHLVTISDGSRLVLSSTRVERADEGGRMLADARSPRAAQVISAEADLAGSFALYAKELIGRLQHGRPVVVGAGRFLGQPVYRLRLGRDRPRVELLVSRRSFAPVAARYTGRWVVGMSLLRPSVPATSARGC
jgi:hypothetical protein